MRNDFVTAILQITNEKGLAKETVISAIESALTSTYKRTFGQVPEVLHPFYRDIVWSWTPFRFAAGGMRSLLQGTGSAPGDRDPPSPTWELRTDSARSRPKTWHRPAPGDPVAREVDRGDGDLSLAASKLLRQPSDLRLRPRDEQQVHPSGGQCPGDVLADAA